MKRACSVRVAKTKSLISCAVNAKLICVFSHMQVNVIFTLACREYACPRLFPACCLCNIVLNVFTTWRFCDWMLNLIASIPGHTTISLVVPKLVKTLHERLKNVM